MVELPEPVGRSHGLHTRIQRWCNAHLTLRCKPAITSDVGFTVRERCGASGNGFELLKTTRSRE
jgi:hypothetical protein